MTTSVKVKEKIEELFTQCSGAIGAVDFKGICKLLWVCLNNSVSMVDLAGIFTVALHSGGPETLSSDLFFEFFKAFARVKYPTATDFCDKLLEELRGAKNLKVSSETPQFAQMMDKNVIKVLLKYDLAIRKAYSNFCGQSVRVGGILSWDDVKTLSVGMEIDGFFSMAGSYNLVPECLSTQQCEILFRDTLTRFPLTGNAATLNSTILYPQFQLLLIMTAMERHENILRKEEKLVSDKSFAKKVFDSKSKPLSELLHDLLRDIGISKMDESAKKNKSTLQQGLGDTLQGSPTGSPGPAHHRTLNSTTGGGDPSHPVNIEPNLFSGSVVAPSGHQPQDMYSSSFNHSRQAMMMRMEHLFDEVESKIMQLLPPQSEILALLASPPDEVLDTKVRLPSKPVVIGDALPVPAQCPLDIEQLLEAALAHHNLGSYEDSLKFLEAAHIHVVDMDQHRKADPHKKPPTAEQLKAMDTMTLDLEMYITLCKGNVYQSCGDDEQSLLTYMEGWTKAAAKNDLDWEVIAINAIGILAYYNLRFDVSLLCFHLVGNYRVDTYSEESVDTATAWNNEACCLYCLNKKGEARIRFERAWNTISNLAGHRSARAVTAWKNLEKARRSHAAVRSGKELKETIAMRVDADRLLMGGTFTIQALAPPEETKKKKTKGGGKKKKK